MGLTRFDCLPALFAGVLCCAALQAADACAASATVDMAANASVARAAKGSPSLGSFLDDEGRLALPAGFSGSLDPTGFALRSRPGEPPRFAAKNAIDDPARWDPQFGQSIGCDGAVNAMASFPDGRIALGGEFTICGNVVVNGVATWDPATGNFAALGGGAVKGVAGGPVTALAIAGSDLIVGGGFSEAGGTATNFVARFNTSTQAWSSLGTGVGNGVNGAVNAVVVSGGDVYVAGGFTQAGGTAARRIARFDTGTQAWSPLGAGAADGVNDFVNDIAVAGSTVYAGGFFTEAGGVPASKVARFDTLSQTWSPLGAGASNGVDGTVVALAVDAGNVYVGGLFSQAGGTTASNIARFDTGGPGWSSLGAGVANGVNNTVVALAVAGGEVFAGGSFTQAGGAAANRAARFDTGAQAWSLMGTAAVNGVNNTVAAFAIVGSNVYVGGGFTQAGGVPVKNVARFNAGSGVWSLMGTGATNGLSSDVEAIAIAGSDIFVGGSFTEAGGVVANRVARFNTTTRSWSSLGTGAANGVSGSVYSIAVSGSDVYVGGLFAQAGGATANRVARFNTNSGLWFPLGTVGTIGVGSGDVRALAIAGGTVFVGGLFNTAGGAPANNIARFNTSTQAWSTLGTGVTSGAVNAIAVSGSDVFVGGTFFQAGGAAATRVARFNTGTGAWSPLGSGVNGAVRAVVIAGSDVFVGGDFRQAGGSPAEGVARFNTNSQAWSSLGSGTANGVLNCDFSICVLGLAMSGSDLYLSGNFTVAGGITANRVARFNTGTQAWSSLGTGTANGVNAYVNAVMIAGTDVYAGGGFTAAGPNVSLRIARYDARRDTAISIATGSGPEVVANGSVTFTASVATTTFPSMPGTVEFLDNGIVIPACASQSLAGGLDIRIATCTTAGLRVGTHGVVARYKGDSLNFIGTSDPAAITILAPTLDFSPASLPTGTFNVPGYSSGTITVSTVAGSGVTPPVTLALVDPLRLPPGLIAVPLANGLSISGTPTEAGSFTFDVRATDSSSTSATGGPFSGIRHYSILVARAAQMITPITRVDAVPLDNGVAFADGDFAVQASASSGLPVTIDSTTPMVCQVIAPGFTVQPLQIGTCTLRAIQGGSTNYEPATEVLRSFQIKATADVAVSSAPNPTLWSIATGQEAAFLTASVETPAGATPTGTVRFQRAGSTIAGCAAQPLSGSGSVATATCTTSSLSRGPNAITALYGGDALHVQTTSNAHAHQLNVETSAGIATITPGPCVVGEACMVGVAVIAANGVPTGSVQVGSSTGGSCTVTLSAGGGSCALTATTAGAGTVTATYLGSPPWLASPAATQVHPFVATVDELFTNGFEPAPLR
jgi:hypothetical protein